MFGEERRNSAGWNLADRAVLRGLLESMESAVSGPGREAAPVDRRNPFGW